MGGKGGGHGSGPGQFYAHVGDIGTAGLVIRLKFTARPVQPALVQRDALKRITMRFREAGTGFANSNVTVQTLAGPTVTEEAVKNPAAATSPSVPASTPEATTTEAARANHGEIRVTSRSKA